MRIMVENHRPIAPSIGMNRTDGVVRRQKSAALDS